MSWWSAAPELLLATAWLFVPGLALLLALGYRRRAAALSAPVISVGLLAGLAVVFGAVGVPWNAPAVAASVALIAAVVLGIRWAVTRREVRAARHTASVGEAADVGSRRTTALLVGGVVLGGLLAAVPLAQGLRPDLMLQAWDNVFQLSATRFVVETANASPFHLQAVSHQVTASVPFYPAAWHGIAALSTVGSVITGSNALLLLLAGAVWPAGLAALARVAVPGRPLVAALAPVVGAGFFAFPAIMLGWGWPNAFAIALLPGLLALTLLAIGADAGPLGQRVLAALLAVLGLAGVGLAHPNGALTFGIVAAPVVLGAAVRAAAVVRRRARTRWGGALAAALLLVGGAAWCVAWAAAVGLAGRQIGDTSQTGTSGFRHGVWLALTGGTGHRGAALTLVVLLMIGTGVVLWRRRAVWLLVSLAAIVALAGVAESTWSVKWVTRAWFMDPSRFRAPTVIFAAIVAAIGLVALAEAGSRVVARLAARGVEARPRGGVTAAVAAVLVVALFVATNGLVAGERRGYFWGLATGAAQPEVAYNLVSTPELAMIERLGGKLEPGRRVLGTPLNGSTLLYVVADIPVVYTNFSGRWPDEAFFLAEHFSEIHENPEVCAALDRLDVGYYYADSTVFNPAHPFHAAYRGLPADPPQPGFELVDHGAGARIYRITACD